MCVAVIPENNKSTLSDANEGWRLYYGGDAVCHADGRVRCTVFNIAQAADSERPQNITTAMNIAQDAFSEL